MKRIIDIINDFNNGETEFVKDIYGGVINFFKVLKKKNLLHLIDFDSVDKYSENSALLFLYESDKENFKKHVLKKLDDVILINDEPHLELGRLSDLGPLFCRNNRHISQETIELVLDGDPDFGFWFDSVGTYDDIIRNLDLKNLELLKKYIVENLKDVEVSPETEVLSMISEKQNSDFVSVTEKNIDTIFQDAESVEFVLENYLEDLDSSLRMIYETAYRDAYNNELEDEILNSLSPYFDTDYKKEKYFLFKIVDFWDHIVFFLKENEGYPTTLNYYSSYITVLHETIECIRIYPPDYPDSRQVNKIINELIIDYI